MSELKISRRRLPHWQAEGSVYFITFRLARGVLKVDERRLVLDHIKSGNGRFYHLIAAVVMSDHVHTLMTLPQGMDLSRVVKGIKGVSARLLNQMRGTRGPVRQDEWWDRIVRDQEEFKEKLTYMCNNPVKRKLVENPAQYDGWFLSPNLRIH